MKAPLHSREAERLATLQSYRILDTDAEAEFDEIVALAARICEAPIALVSLVDSDRQWFKSKIGLEADQTPLEQSICAHAILQDGVFEIEDTLADARTCDNALCLDDPNLRFYAGVPLIAPNGLAIGSFCVLDRKPRSLSDLQKQTLLVLSRQIMRELELRLAIHSQNLLRREMDHRVKNSLQTIASFISLYRRNANHDNPQEAFDAIERRIRAISALHEELHTVGSEQDIQLTRFIERIVSQLEPTAPDGVALRTRLDEVVCGSSVATTLGIVLSEFVANSIKHAFPDERQGVIQIDLSRTDDGGILMVCRDDGVGLQAQTTAETRIEKLGMRLKDAAVAQVNGNLERNASESGYEIRLNIPQSAILR
ncbi:MAG: histidine kinase [Ponticaulis sp.]|nr:histidine kinase [Ponticaulis sp.]